MLEDDRSKSVHKSKRRGLIYLCKTSNIPAPSQNQANRTYTKPVARRRAWCGLYTRAQAALTAVKAMKHAACSLASVRITGSGATATSIQSTALDAIEAFSLLAEFFCSRVDVYARETRLCGQTLPDYVGNVQTTEQKGCIMHHMQCFFFCVCCHFIWSFQRKEYPLATLGKWAKAD